MTNAAKEHWIDQLYEKHECFPYDESSRLSLNLGGNEVAVVLPEYFPDVTPLSVTQQGDLLFVIGYFKVDYHTWKHFGALLIAKRLSEKTYTTVVWHELFPGALKRLALTNDIPAELK